MSRIIALVLLVLGGVLIYYGIQAGDSFASDVKEAIDGTPTDESRNYIIGGVVSAVVGLGLLKFGKGRG